MGKEGEGFKMGVLEMGKVKEWVFEMGVLEMGKEEVKGKERGRVKMSVGNRGEGEGFKWVFEMEKKKVKGKEEGRILKWVYDKWGRRRRKEERVLKWVCSRRRRF